MSFFGTSVSKGNNLVGAGATAAQDATPSFKAGMGSVVMAEERRGERRNRTLRPALLSFNGGTLKAEAVIRDINSNGAKIRLAEPHGLPHEGVAVFKDETGKSQERKMRIVWRLKDEAGIRFV
ncbi:MAG: PilZ domain-containing protein [Nitratireductor sp.]|nr:PilZ domain-containing protein [Nitratireductor sp.]